MHSHIVRNLTRLPDGLGGQPFFKIICLDSSSLRKHPSGEERGETGVFAGYTSSRGLLAICSK